ncbi:MAG: acyl-[acyl-carrier-protein]--UDP-N-acetylglucosamine O-acyltransferase, partial [Candidatus Latescibacterota bacterium]
MIHPTAIISKKAKIAADVSIGPYSVIEDNVEIDSGCEIGPFCRIMGETRIGKNTRIYSHAVIGSPPQDLKY